MHIHTYTYTHIRIHIIYIYIYIYIGVFTPTKLSYFGDVAVHPKIIQKLPLNKVTQTVAFLARM